MKKIAILCDSGVTLTEHENIYTVPLTIIYKNKEYFDGIDMTQKDISSLLENHADLKTAQPNLGVIINKLEEIKDKDYDHVFVLSLSSPLSGTYQAFQHAIDDVGIQNIDLIDSYTVGGPIEEATKVILKLNEENYSPQQITDYLNEEFFKDTETYVFPESLTQLKKGGRISKPAALLASMLKIKPLLKLYNHGESIDKFKTTRTNIKTIEEIIKDLKSKNINPKEHVLYFPHIDGDDIVNLTIDRIKESLGEFECHVRFLPAALACHTGIKTMAVQWAKKTETINPHV